MENKTKPTWLQALEAQSWQAELIASGLAIYGSISLGAYIDSFAEWAALTFNARILDFLHYAFFYIYIGHSIVVVSFIVHLALRIVWAGFLGLSSVFPEGINMKSTDYAAHFLVKAKAEFPDISNYSLRLDNFCSVIFSILCTMVVMFLGISVWIILFIVLAELLSLVVSDTVVDVFWYIIVVLFFAFGFLQNQIVTGSWKESSFAKKYAYTLNQSSGKILLFFAYKPMNYITYTLRTNVTGKQFLIGMFSIMFVGMFVAIPKMESELDFFRERNFFRMNSSKTSATSENYLDKVKKSKILRPIIQSEIIEDNFLQLYIPRYKREKPFITELCGKYKKDENLSKEENNLKRDSFNLACRRQYYQVFIDDLEIPNLNFRYKRHEHDKEKGYQTFIPLDSLSNGEHVLKIVMAYKNDEGENAVRYIPFYKTND